MRTTAHRLCPTSDRKIDQSLPDSDAPNEHRGPRHGAIDLVAARREAVSERCHYKTERQRNLQHPGRTSRFGDAYRACWSDETEMLDAASNVSSALNVPVRKTPSSGVCLSRLYNAPDPLITTVAPDESEQHSEHRVRERESGS